MKRIAIVAMALAMAMMAVCLTACGQSKYAGKAEEMMPTVVKEFGDGGKFVTPSDYHLVEVKENTGHGYENLVTATYENNTYKIVARFMADNDGNLTYLDISDVEAIAPVDLISIAAVTQNPSFATNGSLDIPKDYVPIADMPNTSVTFDEQAQTCAVTFDNYEIGTGTYGRAYLNGSCSFDRAGDEGKWRLSKGLPISVDPNVQELEGTYACEESGIPTFTISNVQVTSDNEITCSINIKNDVVDAAENDIKIKLVNHMNGFSLRSEIADYQIGGRDYIVKLTANINTDDAASTQLLVIPEGIYYPKQDFNIKGEKLTFTKQ